MTIFSLSSIMMWKLYHCSFILSMSAHKHVIMAVSCSALILQPMRCKKAMAYWITYLASHDSFPPQAFLYTPSIWPDTQHTDLLLVSRATKALDQSSNMLPTEHIGYSVSLCNSLNCRWSYHDHGQSNSSRYRNWSVFSHWIWWWRPPYYVVHKLAKIL